MSEEKKNENVEVSPFTRAVIENLISGNMVSGPLTPTNGSRPMIQIYEDYVSMSVYGRYTDKSHKEFRFDKSDLERFIAHMCVRSSRILGYFTRSENPKIGDVHLDKKNIEAHLRKINPEFDNLSKMVHLYERGNHKEPGSPTVLVNIWGNNDVITHGVYIGSFPYTEYGSPDEQTIEFEVPRDRVNLTQYLAMQSHKGVNLLDGLSLEDENIKVTCYNSLLTGVPMLSAELLFIKKIEHFVTDSEPDDDDDDFAI